MLILPLQAAPQQTLNISLNGQACTLNIYSAGEVAPDGSGPPMFLDLYVANVLIEGGIFALIGVRLIRDSYLGFLGDLVWNDTQPDPSLGPQNPLPGGVGARWQLLYLYPGELTGDV
jgi:hypothetical protein